MNSVNKIFNAFVGYKMTIMVMKIIGYEKIQI